MILFLPPSLPLSVAAGLEDSFYRLESFLFSSLGVWCAGELARRPAKCVVSISPCIRAVSSCPRHHMRHHVGITAKGQQQPWLGVQCQPAWSVGDFWFHSDTVPDWAGGCSRSHLTRFSSFILKYGKYFTVNTSVLNSGYVQKDSLGDAKLTWI